MSRAFVKEQDGADVVEELPDRLVSDAPNLVTDEGMAQIEAEVARLTKLYAEAQASGDRSALAATSRELRYWTARRSSAELMPKPADSEEVRFGSSVTIQRADGRRQTFRIVGEDEADPAQGRLSYVAPLARALIGKAVGDEVKVGPAPAGIVAIE